MRQIKFRGKSARGGEWVYGDLIHLAVPNGTKGCAIITNDKVEDVFPDNKLSKVVLEYTDEEVTVVFDNTVGQFTGLHDKNGTEIYEGDIVVEPIFFDKPRKVFWDDRFGRFGCIALTTMGYLALFDYGDEVEVIGNIFDHPELMNPKNE